MSDFKIMSLIPDNLHEKLIEEVRELIKEKEDDAQTEKQKHEDLLEQIVDNIM